QQYIGVTRRGHEAEAETLEIVIDVVERVDFELAAIAGARVHLANGQAAAEHSARARLKSLRQLRQHGIIGRRARLGQRATDQILEQELAHLRLHKSCPE